MRNIDGLIRSVAPYSDMSEQSLRFLAEAFYLAHDRAPRGASVEVGTRCGGSALLCLALLRELYDGQDPPLHTVDPYGMKPYKGGDATIPGLYGDGEYVAMKGLLASFANHIHWRLEGVEFLREPPLIWWKGEKAKTSAFSFVLLDGDHDEATVRSELACAMMWMRPGGVIVIDNVDKDPGLLPWILASAHGFTHSSPAAPGAAMVRIEL